MTLSLSYAARVNFLVCEASVSDPQTFLTMLRNQDSHPGEAMISGERADNLRTFSDRLQIAKRKVDSRIATLGGADNSVSTGCAAFCR
jgi:hypothetical protein